MLAEKLRSATTNITASIITLVGTSSNETSNGSSTVTVNKPTGVVSGNLLIAIMAGGASSITWTGDTGWTEVADQNASPNLRVAYKVAGSSEPASYTFTTSSAVNKSAIVAAFSNASYGQIGSFGTVVVTSSTSTVTAPSITIAGSGSVLLAAFGANGAIGTGWGTAPSGMSIAAVEEGAVNAATALYYASVSSGVSGDRTVSFNTSGSSSLVGVLIELT